MGRSVRQKRKNRSGRSVVRQPASKRRPVNPTGNPIIAQNWDKRLTLAQNYRHLGLMNRLGHFAGGREKLGSEVAVELAKAKAEGKSSKKPNQLDSFDVYGMRTRKNEAAAVREVHVERDANGKIVRIVGEAVSALNPLNDLLNDLDNAEEEGEKNEQEEDGDNGEEWGGLGDDGTTVAATVPVVRALEAMARQPTGPKHVRQQSQAEHAWLQTLVDHYKTAMPDEDTLAAMARDRRRNPFQRTAADLRRRLAKFRADGGTLTVEAPS